MKGLVKWVGGIIAALVILIVLAAIVLPQVIDPNDYRDDISALVKDETGMTLSINGEIGWSVFPWLGLSLNDLQIDDTHQKKLGSLQYAAVEVKLLPLLSRKVKVSKLELKGLSLDMEVNAQGQANWEPAKKQETAQVPTQTSPTPSPSAQEEKSSGSLPEFDISAIAITDLNVTYRDIPAKRTVSITDARLETGAVRPGQPFQLSSSFNLKNTNPVIATGISLEGMITPDSANAMYKAENLKLSVTPLNVSNPETLALRGHAVVKGSDISGDIKVNPLDLALLMQQLKLPVPALSGGDKVLRKVSLGTTFTKKGNRVDLNKVSASFDDFSLNGTIAVTDLKKQAIAFNITGNDLIVDPYLPIATADQQAADKPAQTSGNASGKPSGSTSPASTGDEVIIPVDTIKSLNIKGSAQLNSLTVKGLLFEKPTLEVKAANGNAQVTKLNAGFYKGVIDAAAGVDVSGLLAKRPRVSARADIKAINLEALSAQIVDLKKITGKTNADLKVVGHGLTQNQITRSLNGEVDFSLVDGALLGTNFNKSVCGLVAQVRKEKLTKTDWPDKTEFKALKGSVKIIDGVARNRDLTAALDQLNLKGDGEVNLVNQTMDYHLGLTITGDTASEEESACRINEKYADISWPLRCKGRLGESGLCGVDEQRLGKTIGKILEQEAKDKIRKKLEEKLGGSLKDLFKKK
ncbi:AsmA family protein [Sansalvadorimonas sp. 2012CJ34-2]|uniref:AsmA family protein n=1 Tax=Parendozoicomonas callyspongiae TaxID=2942213 RepID=A0ABT0PEC8_9GAMM|nr:AsmA family protein [Sansalvadorimonas sp. 2012CJ34-2]MCL6269663.1 AsmA family protein [Sansalvadorimonas sp. 2012CJ34-2]